MNLNGFINKPENDGSSSISYTQIKSRSVFRSLFSPINTQTSLKTGINNISSFQSSRMLLDSTINSNNALFSLITQEINNKQKFNNPPSRLDILEINTCRPTTTTKSKTSKYNEISQRNINKTDIQRNKINKFNYSSPPSVKKNNFLKNSMYQRREFVQGIEDRLRGFKDEKLTSNFKNLSNEKKIRSLNFKNEMEKLRNTLNDIK